MSTLAWDRPSERLYQTGVDRGAIYLQDGTVVAWNGITGVEDGSNSDVKPYYMDGVKILNDVVPSDYVGKLKAFTYPEEFDEVLGIATAYPGLSYYEQPPKSFNLSYRTRVGNDIMQEDYGYKIHLLYNLVAVSSSNAFETIHDSVTPIEFVWDLSGTPQQVEGYRPMVHISVDSTGVLPDLLQSLEDVLYGTDTTSPRFPLITEVADIFGAFGALVITDNGDGTWTATDTSNDYIEMTDPTTFEIHDADATYSDADTYNISSTNI